MCILEEKLPYAKGRRDFVSSRRQALHQLRGASHRGHEPLLQKATGSVRFEIVDGTKTDHWLLTVDKGTLGVSHKRAASANLVRAEKALFDRVVSGDQNPVAALLRDELVVDGDWRFLVLVQRLFPGPPRSHRRGRSARSAGRST